MKRSDFRFAAAGTTILLGLVLAASSAGAGPIWGQYADDARGDVVFDQLLTRELGDVAIFAAGEAVQYHSHRYNFTIGVPEDGVANDWTVHMTNVSGQSWRELFFVANHGATIGNADGKIEDAAGAPGLWNDAFRIDAAGTNANLLHESIISDGIFQPGEEWEFAVSNFGTGLNARPPDLISPGIFSGSSLAGSFQGNASLLAVPLPEPATTSSLGLFAMAMLTRRRRRGEVLDTSAAMTG